MRAPYQSLLAAALAMEASGFATQPYQKAFMRQIDFENQKSCLRIHGRKFRHRNAKRGRK